MKKILILLSLIVISCSKQDQSQFNEQSNNPSVTEEQLVVNESLGVQLIDMGVVNSSKIMTKRLILQNLSLKDLNINMSDAIFKMTGTPFSVSKISCSKLLRQQTCFIEFKMSYDSIYDYSQQIMFNVFDSSSQSLLNPDMGKVTLTGSKKDPTIVINQATTEFIITPSTEFIKASTVTPKVIKRFYIKNISTKIYSMPTINVPSDMILTNHCGLKIQSMLTCYFDVEYNYSSDVAKASYQESITFTSNDQTLDTSALSILLNITNIDNYIAPVLNVVQPSIPVIDHSKTYRFYVQNSGTQALNGTPYIDKPYEMVKTSCSSVQPGTSCYIDFKIGAIDNVKGINMALSYSGQSYQIKAGDQSTVSNTVLCDPTYSYYNNNCVILSQSKSCPITNGAGLQNSNDGGSTWTTCEPTYCDATYIIVNSQCVKSSQSRQCGPTFSYQSYSSDGGRTWGPCWYVVWYY
jgi:hypothetical protein